MRNEQELRDDITQVCKAIHAKGWISSTDGNVSARLRRDRILITPSGIHKGFMKPRDLIVIDNKGNLVSGRGKPSSEMMMHITCYEERPDIGAVVHAHPTLSVAFSVARIKLAKCLLPEVVFTLGSIPTAKYAPPTTDEVPKSIRKHIKDFDAVILERHGSVTVGEDVFTAYNALERMEHVAEITYYARQLGSVEPLSGKQIARLQEIGREKGWPEKKIIHDNCNECNACNKFSQERNEASYCDDAKEKVATAVVTSPSEDVVEMIVNEVVASMKS